MRNKKIINCGLATCLAGSVYSALPAYAEDAFKTAALEEIIVTATRRAENINDIPIAVQAFSENMLQETGAIDPIGLATITPNLNITTHLMGVTPYIRGVGNPISATIAEASVALYIDGSYIKSSNASAFEYNNIERIEVLKGPQGTLFGRNATGGLIHIITKDPSYEAGVRGKVSAGSYETVRTSLYANTGITDNLAADIAINYKNQADGWGTNRTTGKDVDEGKSLNIRTKWKWEVSDQTSLTLSADYTDIESSFGTYNRPLPGTTPLFGFASPDGYYDSVDSLPGDEWIKDSGAALTIEHSTDGLDFKSITTYRYTESGSHFDQVTSPLALVDILIDDQESENFAQELQLYSSSGALDWLVGVYYFHDNAGFNSLQLQGPLIAGGAGVQEIRGPQETNSYSIYGEGTYAITDDTRLTLGARWTKDEREIVHSVFFNGAPLVSIPQEAEWEEPSYRVILGHDLNEDTMVYTSYSRGYKAGNHNSSGVGAPAFNPEFLDAYEVGAKTTLANGQVQLNTAAFYYDYQDLQTSRVVAGSLFTVNAAAAKIYGVEFDMVANVTNRLQIIAGAGWLHNEYDDFEDAPRLDPNPNFPFGNIQTAFDASGQKLPRVPEWTANIGGSYFLGMVAEGELKISVNLFHNDGFYWVPSNRQRQDAYDLLHAGISWRNADDTFGIRVYGDNLLDEEYSNYTSEQPIGDIFQPAAPRTYFLELSYSM
jgi:iron complex outermembrane recepter protein